MTVSTGIDSLDRSIHNANAWLRDLVDELGEDRQSAYRMLRAFLHLLRDRLPPEEGAHLAAQLPHLWRGVFYEGWSPAVKSTRTGTGRASSHVSPRRLSWPGRLRLRSPLRRARRCLRAHIDEGEFRHVLDVLPGALVPIFQAA